MTELLLRIFVKNAHNPSSAETKAACGRLSGRVCILCNVLLFSLKLAVGTLSNSIAVTADAFNNLSDASSNVITLVGYKIAAKPADTEHPYGHARFEYVASLSVAVMMIVIALELGKSSVEKIFSPSPVSITAPFIISLLISITVKAWMMLFNTKLGRLTDSPVLLTTAADSRNDIISTFVVLLGGIVHLKFKVNIDAYLGLGVAAFIFISGTGFIKNSLSLIMGRGVSEDEEIEILHKLLSFEGVLGAHDLMLHDYGMGRRFGSVHVEMDCSMPPLKSHETIDEMERTLKKEMGIDIVIHYDPIPVGERAEGTLYGKVESAVRELGEGISMHDVCVLRRGEKPLISFDMIVPENFPLSEEAAAKAIELLLKNKYNEDYMCAVTLDKGFAPIQKQK